jgi:hypothetical protein
VVFYQSSFFRELNINTDGQNAPTEHSSLMQGNYNA